MSAVLQELPLPARLVPWDPALHTTLARCVLLALLLHLWAVLTFGTAPGGTARPGEGVGGRLNITLRGPVSEGAREAPPAPPVQPAPGVAAESAVPRWGGSVRQREALPESLPGAAQLGVPAAPLPLPVPDTPVRSSPAPALPEPGRVLQERAAEPAPPQPPQPAPAAEPAPAEGRLQAPAAAAPVNNLRLAPQPALPQVAPLPLPEGPSATVAQPAPARELVSPLLQGPLVTAAPAPALPQPATAPVAAPERVTLPTPSAVPDTLPAAPAPTPAAARPMAATPQPDGGPAAAGSRVGHDVATPGAAAASAPKKLNLELNRPRGGELSRWGSMGALPVLPRLPERDEKLAREIEKAGKADCSKAYREAGLAAVVPLVADALKKEGGCKW